MKKLISIMLVTVFMTLLLSGCSKENNTNGNDKTPTNNVTDTKNEDPIKIGVLVPLTGAFASLGVDGMEGTKMAFEEVDYTIGGRKVELFFEDTAADPDLCIQKTSRLVEREKVDLILGPLSGGEATALKGYADRIPDTTIVVAGAASEDVTMRGVPDNIFRTAYTGAQTMFAFGDFAYDELGYRKIVTLAEDYDFPFSQVGGFMLNFVRKGGEVSDRLWVNVGTQDYSSIIAQIPEDIDAVYVALGGTDAINFIKQFNDFGYNDKIDILGGSITVDTSIISTDAGAFLEGVYSGSHYAQVLPYPEFDKFDTDYNERFGRPSSLFAADYYIGAKVALAALEAVDGNVEDQTAYREALLKVEMNTPRGPFKFDEYHNVIEHVYINQVQNVDGVLRNIVVETYEDQTQFGPYDPQWYQSQPSFDRTNPTVESINGAKLAE